MYRFRDPILQKMAEAAAETDATMSGPYMSVQEYFGINHEIVRGTAPSWVGSAPLWLPIDPNPTFTPMVTMAKDIGLRGSPVTTYDDVPLNSYSKMEFGGNVFPDTFGGILLGLLGGPDTVSGTVGPYTHSIPLLNAAESGSQPPSWSLVDVDLIEEVGTTDNAKQITGGQFDQLDIDFAATGALSYKGSFIGNPYSEITKPSSSFSTEIFIPAYNGVAMLNGSQNFLILKGAFSFKRGTAPIFTIGQPGPYRNWAGPIDVSGSLEILALQDDLTMLNGLTYSKQPLSIAFTEPQSGHSVRFQMSRLQFTEPKYAKDQPYMRATVNFTGEANTTDAAGGGGYSPLTTSVTNSLISAY